MKLWLLLSAWQLWKRVPTEQETVPGLYLELQEPFLDRVSSKPQETARTCHFLFLKKLSRGWEAPVALPLCRWDGGVGVWRKPLPLLVSLVNLSPFQFLWCFESDTHSSLPCPGAQEGSESLLRKSGEAGVGQ